MNARTDEQRAAEWARAYGSPERAEWVQRQPSVASGETPCVNAHTETGGTSRKADYRTTAPLTWDEHHELHQHGQRTFEAKYGVDLKAAAAETERRWQEYQRTNPQLPW